MIMGGSVSKRFLERIHTYVQGLDEVLNGGIIKESILLIAGGSGTGKTVLASQIAYFNALHSKNVIYVSFDEGLKLKDYLKGFGWDLDKLIEERKFKLLDLVAPTETLAKDIITFIAHEIREFNAKLLVLDSLTTLLLNTPELAKARSLVDVLRKIKPPGVTVIATANVFYGTRRIGTGVEEVIADTIILLKRFIHKGELRTKLYVLKMRGSAHSRRAHELVFTNTGVKVIPLMPA